MIYMKMKKKLLSHSDFHLIRNNIEISDKKKTFGDRSLINLSDLGSCINRDKVVRYVDDMKISITNYVVYQRFNSFRWPLWVHQTLTPDSPVFNSVTNLRMGNNCCRNWAVFSNLLSIDKLIVDQSGMISPTYDDWSIEFWLLSDGKIFRPQETTPFLNNTTQDRDTSSSVVTTSWKEKPFEVKTELYGARTTIDEAVAEISYSSSKKSSAYLLVVIRPYNATKLSGIFNAAYQEETGSIRINGTDRIIISSAPDLVSCGNGSEGDVFFTSTGNAASKVSCKDGMATIALGYKIKNNSQSLHLRISLDGQKGISPQSMNYTAVKKDFCNYINHRTQNGITISVPDPVFQKWFYASKLLSLNSSTERRIARKAGSCNTAPSRSRYFVVTGYNRMGYYNESLSLISQMFKELPDSEKITFEDAIDLSYAILTVADYFTISRDLEFLQSYFEKLKTQSGRLLDLVQRILGKKINVDKLKNNSLLFNFSNTMHVYDIILISYTFREYSYLARCIGLFGEEIKYGKSADALDAIINRNITKACSGISTISSGKHHGDDTEPEENAEDEGSALFLDDISYDPSQCNEFIGYYLFSGFPFTIEALDKKHFTTLLKNISDYYKSNMLYVPSAGGYDILLSLIYAQNLLLQKDPACIDIFKTILKMGGNTYSVPEFVNPATGYGVNGQGDPPHFNAMLFQFMRNLLFIDHSNRLELFPIPHEDWFKPGVELTINDAPSRFGVLHIRIVNTQNEIHFHFPVLPKFVPPDIMINLPVKVSLKEEDDFVIKKRYGNTFIINGWPSIIRFSRR